MNETTQLKFPKTETFTSQEFADVNGKSKLELLVQFQTLIKTNKIVCVGSKPNSSGRGRQTNLYQISNGHNISIVSTESNVVSSPKVISTIEMKIPDEIFTHQDFADLNGKDKPNTYLQLKSLIDEKKIVLCGKRNPTGRGKPTNLFVKNNGQTIEFIQENKKEKQSLITVEKEEKTVVYKNSGEYIHQLPDVEPSVAPVINIVSKNIEDENLEKNIQSSVMSSVNLAFKNPREFNQKCPVCDNNCLAENDSTGVVIWCHRSHEEFGMYETPSGHGRNEMSAYHTMCEKYVRKPRASAVK